MIIKLREIEAVQPLVLLVGNLSFAALLAGPRWFSHVVELLLYIFPNHYVHAAFPLRQKSSERPVY